MATNSTPYTIDIPNFGQVPVQVNQDPDRGRPVEITTRPPDRGRPGTDDNDPRLRFRDGRIVRVEDDKNYMPQYAVLRHKVVLISQTQLDGLLAKTLSVATPDNKGGLGQELITVRVTVGDCPEPDLDMNGEVQHTVLLEWDEETRDAETAELKPFPAIVLFDSKTRAITTFSQENQQNDFLVSTTLDGPHNPPVYPPSAVGSLNSQPSDFRPASPEDIAYYEQQVGQDSGPVVAVMDTGLKFNVLSPTKESEWPDPYMYRDVDGHERRFTLSYQNQPDTLCNAKMAQNHLGYCALLSYREQPFIDGITTLATTLTATPYTKIDVINSPFDDFRLLKDPADENSLMDARHGTSVTAIIQQNGDDAPVVPVKIFDNIGFATLFDVLNGFNYILHRCKTTNIRVVNASWIFGQDNPLVKKKIEQLLEAGVFVIAAAGNEGQTDDRSLDKIPVYPACYSDTYPNVITVTSVRKTYFRPDILSPKEDSVIGKVLAKVIDFGLFNVIETAEDLMDKIVPTAGYVAVENYSPKYVSVGVVSTFGYFRSPFWKSPIIRGSSFACAFVTGFVIRQLRTRPDLLASIASGHIADVRQELLRAMNGSGPDENLKNEYVNGGCYLAGYEVD